MNNDPEEILDNVEESALEYEIRHSKKWLYILAYPALIGGVLGFVTSAIGGLSILSNGGLPIEFWIVLGFWISFAGIIVLGYRLFLAPREMDFYLKSKEESDLVRIHQNQLRIWKVLLFFFFLLLLLATLFVWEAFLQVEYTEPGFDATTETIEGSEEN